MQEKITPYQRAERLFWTLTVEPTDVPDRYKVTSPTGKEYIVTPYGCTCEYNQFKMKPCYHLLSLDLLARQGKLPRRLE